MGKSKRSSHADHTKKKTTAKARRSGPECAVCLDPLKKTDAVRTLPCHHRFHTECVQKILDSGHVRNVCPLCRANIETDEQQLARETAAAGFGGMPPLRRQESDYRAGWRPTQNELAGLGWAAGGDAAAGATGPFGHPSGAPPHPNQFGPGGGGGGITQAQREAAETAQAAVSMSDVPLNFLGTTGATEGSD